MEKDKQTLGAESSVSTVFRAYALKDEFLKNAAFSVYNDTKTRQKRF